jgi:PAS domain S-box-containing protein
MPGQKRGKANGGNERLQQVLYRIADAAVHATDLVDLYPSIHRYLGELLDTTNFYIALHEGNDSFSFPYSVDQYDNGVEFGPQELKNSLTAYVFRTQEPLLATESVHDELIKRGETEQVGTPSKIWLGVPLRTDKGVIGVMALQSYTDGALYSEEDVEMMSFVSDQVAAAIERKRADEAVRASVEVLQMVINATNDAMIVIGEDGLITLFNRAAEKMFGRKREEMLGRPLDCLMPIDYRGPHRRYIKGYFTTGNPSGVIGRVVELPAVRKDGSVFTMEISLSAGKFEREQFVIGVARDISERKQAEEVRLNLEEQLRQAQKMEAIGTLAGGIAHDFNNILGAIMGYSELLRIELDLPEKSKARRHLDQVLTASGRARDLVQQILAFSRKDKKKRRPVLLNNVVKEVIKMLRSVIPTTIEIRVDADQVVPRVMADYTQLHQVIMNLCTNAAHAMNENGGNLEIALKETGTTANPFVRLTVADTGRGMNPEVKRHVFEPYFSTKKRGEGTGMGLAVVHGIVKSHGGDIMVESEPGMGTTFHISFPVTEANEKPDDGKETIELKGGNERILFVDDEQVLVEMEKMQLESLGYKVEARTGSIEALAAFRAGPGTFDLVVTDLTMPHMTGIHLAQEIKGLRNDIPIILCTGYSERISEETAREKGISALIMKPVAMNEMAGIVREVLDARETREKHEGVLS